MYPLNGLHGYCLNSYILELGKRFEGSKPSFICCAFEAKFLPLNFCSHAHFDVC